MFFLRGKLNLLHGALHGQDKPKAIIVFRSESLAFFTITSIHSIRKNTKNRNGETT